MDWRRDDDRSMNLTRSINLPAIMEAECSIPDSASGSSQTSRAEDRFGAYLGPSRASGAFARPSCKLLSRCSTAAEGNSRNDPGTRDRERNGKAGAAPPLPPSPRNLAAVTLSAYPRPGGFSSAFPPARLNYRRNAWRYRVAVNSVKASYVNKRMMLRAGIPPRAARGCKCAVIRV